MNTHESYVSLETAKLLKQAGFDWEIYDGYILYEDGGSFVTKFQTPHNFNGDNGELFNNYLHHKEILSRPTFSIAQKWLREVKETEIEIQRCENPNPLARELAESVYNKEVKRKFTYSVNILDENDESIYDKQGFQTYEKALESGIKKCLKIISDKD